MWTAELQFGPFRRISARHWFGMITYCGIRVRIISVRGFRQEETEFHEEGVMICTGKNGLTDLRRP